jgi:hypothetical protein
MRTLSFMEISTRMEGDAFLDVVEVKASALNAV